MDNKDDNKSKKEKGVGGKTLSINVHEDIHVKEKVG